MLTSVDRAVVDLRWTGKLVRSAHLDGTGGRGRVGGGPGQGGKLAAGIVFCELTFNVDSEVVVVVVVVARCRFAARASRFISRQWISEVGCR